jgi:hypothetical protein
MATNTTALDRSPEALRELRGELPARVVSGDLQDSLDVLNAYQKSEREFAEQQVKDRNERVATETLQMIGSVSAGALSTWRRGNLPIGGAANLLIGGAAKVGAYVGFDNRVARVACQVGKTLLHGQLSIITRESILGAP